MPINRWLSWLLVAEAVGAFAIAGLMLATPDFLGDVVVPWFLAVVPSLLGVMFLLVARQVASGARWRFIYALWAQGWVLTAGAVGLVFSGSSVLWLGMVMGVAGIALAVFGQKEEQAFAWRDEE